jgi:hypothetical protein
MGVCTHRNGIIAVREFLAFCDDPERSLRIRFSRLPFSRRSDDEAAYVLCAIAADQMTIGEAIEHRVLMVANGDDTTKRLLLAAAVERVPLSGK